MSSNADRLPGEIAEPLSSEPVRLLRIDARCDCGARPNMRIAEDERDLALLQAPDKLKQTWHCQRCGKPHDLTARSFQRAVG